jgi:hypothetical protein
LLFSEEDDNFSLVSLVRKVEERAELDYIAGLELVILQP